MSSNYPDGVTGYEEIFTGPRKEGQETWFCNECDKDTKCDVEHYRHYIRVHCDECGSEWEEDVEPPTREDEYMERQLGW